MIEYLKSKKQINSSPAYIFYMLFAAMLFLVLVLLFPFGLVWCLNTLFVLSIPYSFWTWLASLGLYVTVVMKVKSRQIKQNGIQGKLEINGNTTHQLVK